MNPSTTILQRRDIDSVWTRLRAVRMSQLFEKPLGIRHMCILHASGDVEDGHRTCTNDPTAQHKVSVSLETLLAARLACHERPPVRTGGISQKESIYRIALIPPDR